MTGANMRVAFIRVATEVFSLMGLGIAGAVGRKVGVATKEVPNKAIATQGGRPTRNRATRAHVVANTGVSNKGVANMGIAMKRVTIVGVRKNGCRHYGVGITGGSNRGVAN